MWSSVTKLPTGTPLVVDASPKTHRARVVGRLVERRRGEITLRKRDGMSVAVPARCFHRARVVEGLFEREDFVLRRDLSADEWRGVVLETVDGLVRVQKIDGFEWIPEESLEHADDRDHAYALSLPRMKPGPVHHDSVAEAVNQTVFEESDQRWAE